MAGRALSKLKFKFYEFSLHVFGLWGKAKQPKQTHPNTGGTQAERHMSASPTPWN